MNEELTKQQRSERLRVIFEEVKTMKMMNFSLDEMTDTLQLHPDYAYFVNQYLDAHVGEDLETIVASAYELLYGEAPPLQPKTVQSMRPKAIEPNKVTMEMICTKRLLKDFLKARVEFMICKMAAGQFNVKEFVAAGYDKAYALSLVRIIKLFSPVDEITQENMTEVLQDKSCMQAIVNRAYEDLYILTKRKRMWSCDWIDFVGLKICKEVCSDD